MTSTSCTRLAATSALRLQHTQTHLRTEKKGWTCLPYCNTSLFELCDCSISESASSFQMTYLSPWKVGCAFKMTRTQKYCKTQEFWSLWRKVGASSFKAVQPLIAEILGMVSATILYSTWIVSSPSTKQKKSDPCHFETSDSAHHWYILRAKALC